jgi:hypothetical protein
MDACLILDLSITSGFFVKGMTQQIDRDIFQVDIIGAHTMFFYCVIRAIFQELVLSFTFYNKIAV